MIAKQSFLQSVERSRASGEPAICEITKYELKPLSAWIESAYHVSHTFCDPYTYSFGDAWKVTLSPELPWHREFCETAAYSEFMARPENYWGFDSRIYAYSLGAKKLGNQYRHTNWTAVYHGPENPIEYLRQKIILAVERKHPRIFVTAGMRPFIQKPGLLREGTYAYDEEDYTLIQSPRGNIRVFDIQVRASGAVVFEDVSPSAAKTALAVAEASEYFGMPITIKCKSSKIVDEVRNNIAALSLSDDISAELRGSL